MAQENKKEEKETTFKDWQTDELNGRFKELTGREKDRNAAFMIACIIEDFKRAKDNYLIKLAPYKYWKLCSLGMMENDGIWKGAREINYNSKWTSLDHETLIRNFFKSCHKNNRNLETELLPLKLELEKFL